MSEKIYTRGCRICGEPIEFTYRTKRKIYCEKCKADMERSLRREHEQKRKVEAYLERRSEQIAHQRDRSVWTPDYAERQKARTLAMLGKIET